MLLKAQWTISALLLLGLSGLSLLQEATAAEPSVEEPARYSVKLATISGGGMFAVRIVANRSDYGFFAKLGGLDVINIETGRHYSFLDSAPLYFAESLYAGALPPGTYRLASFARSARNLGIGYVRETIPVPQQSGRFRIGAGRITDLGTMFYVRPLSPLNTESYQFAFEPRALATTRSSEFWNPLPRPDPADLLGWETETAGERREPLNPELRRTTLNVIGSGVRWNSKLLFGEAFGQLAARTEDGKWVLEQLPAVNLIESVAAAPDGSLAAGADEGGVWLRDAKSTAWSYLPLPRADIQVRYLAFDSKQRLVAVAESAQNALVYVSDGKDLGWKLLQSFAMPMEKRGISPDRFTDARMTRDELKIYTNYVGYTSTENTVHTLSLADARFSSESAHTGGHLGLLPDGSLVSVSGANVSRHLQISVDGGKTWQERTVPNWAMVPVFRTQDEGYLLRLETIPIRGPMRARAEGVQLSVWRTADGARSWEKASDAPKDANRIILLDEPGSMLIVTDDGRIAFTSDSGQTWSEEKSAP